MCHMMVAILDYNVPCDGGHLGLYDNSLFIADYVVS